MNPFVDPASYAAVAGVTVAHRPLRACALTFEPGNGTRYDLLVTEHPHGGATWTWAPGTDVVASGWASGGSFQLRQGKMSKAEQGKVAFVVCAIVRELEAAQNAADLGNNR